ncbi:MAG: DNA polymerase III subunit epsilon [Alphaproteobacteria bacterium GWF2_58_20]|nr:MAG: DNA polymerase III subunit epsilon [Alphaproteobacteria bacterium GWF2_58_20]
MREIILDTETTGFDPLKGDRLVEIGCVEVDGLLPTGRVFHHYVNPERDIPSESTAVHGITNEFVVDKPVFSEIVGDFLDFIEDMPLVIHNAEFDMKFLNAELARLGFPALPMSRAVDTLIMARRAFPGSPASLDALCRRFGVDNSSRTTHGALLDAQLLAECYLELRGGRQPDLIPTASSKSGAGETMVRAIPVERPFREARPHAPLPEESVAHAEMLAQLKKPIWNAE